MPQSFTVNLLNRNAEKEEEKKNEMGAETYIEQVKGKAAEDYEQFQRPSETKPDKFSENEK